MADVILRENLTLALNKANYNNYHVELCMPCYFVNKCAKSINKDARRIRILDRIQWSA